MNGERRVVGPRPFWLVEAEGSLGHSVVVVSGVRRRVARWVAALVGGRIRRDDGRREWELRQQSLPWG